jgi:hypothetical protein
MSHLVYKDVYGKISQKTSPLKIQCLEIWLLATSYGPLFIDGFHGIKLSPPQGSFSLHTLVYEYTRVSFCETTISKDSLHAA